MPQPERRLRRRSDVAALPPAADPAEAVERIVPRRRLLFEDRDVIMMQVPSGLGLTGRVYQLRIRGSGPLPERFVSFERAAVAGDQLAVAARVRLFYVDSESEQEVPHLLKDYRPARRRDPNR